MARKTERVSYEVDMKLNAAQANKALSSIVDKLEGLTKHLSDSASSTDKHMKSLTDMLKEQNQALSTQLGKLTDVNKQVKSNTEQVKKQSDYAKELSRTIAERDKLEEQLNGKKMKSVQALQDLVTRYENQLAKSDKARAISAKERSDTDKKNFLDKKKYADIEVKLLNAKIDLQKRADAENVASINRMLADQKQLVSAHKTGIKDEAALEKKLQDLRKEAYELEKLRLVTAGKQRALDAEPPTTATTQAAELRTLKDLAALEKKTHGETLEFYKLEKRAVEKARDLKKTQAMDEKKATHDRIVNAEATAKAEEQINVLKEHGTREVLKQSDVLKGDLRVMQARLDVLRKTENIEHTITEQARLQEQMAKKQVTLQKTLASEKKAVEDNSMLGTVKHAAQVAPVYMAVAQSVNAIQTALSATIQDMLEFDNTMRVLSAVTNENLHTTKQLTTEIMELGTAYGGALSDYAETAKELSRAGIDTSELVNATKVTAQLGLITGDTIQSASNAIISYSQVYQKAGNKMVYTTEELGNKLAYMANASRLSTEDIGTLSNYALASSKSVGMTVDVVNGLAVAFSNAGNNASTIGTQIRRFTSTLTSNSTAVKEFYAFTGTNRETLVNAMSASKSGLPEDIQKSNDAFADFVRNVQSLSENEYRNAIQGMNILDNQFFNQLRNNGDEIVGHIQKSYSDLTGELDKTTVIADGISKRWEEMWNRFTLGAEHSFGSLPSMATDGFEKAFNHVDKSTSAMGTTFSVLKDSLTSLSLDPLMESMERAKHKGADLYSELSRIRDLSTKTTDDEALAGLAQEFSYTKQIITATAVINQKRKDGIKITDTELANLDKLTLNKQMYKAINEDLLKGDRVHAQVLRDTLHQQLADNKKLLDLKLQQKAADDVKKAAKTIDSNNNVMESYGSFSGDLSAADKAKVELLAEENLALEKKVVKLAVIAGMNEEELRALGLSKEVIKTTNEEVFLAHQLKKEELQSVSTLVESLKSTTDIRRINLGLSAVEAKVAQNTRAAAVYSNMVAKQDVLIKESGLAIAYEEHHVGQKQIESLIKQGKYAEAMSTIALTTTLLETERVKLNDEYNKASKEGREILDGQKGLIKGQISNYESIYQVLTGNVDMLNSTSSLNSNITSILDTQLAGYKRISDELRLQGKVKIQTAGLDKQAAIDSARDAEYKKLNAEFANQEDTTSIMGVKMVEELTKKAHEIEKHYAEETSKAKIEIERKRAEETKKLDLAFEQRGKSTSQRTIARYKKERDEQLKLFKDSKEMQAKIEAVYQDKVKTATTKGVTRTNTKNAKDKNSGDKEANNTVKIAGLDAKILEYRKLINGESIKQSDKLKADLETLREKQSTEKRTVESKQLTADILAKELSINKALASEERAASTLSLKHKREALSLAQQEITIAQKQKLLETGEVDKVMALQSDLSMLKEQLKLAEEKKDVYALTIDILNKEYEIKKAVKSVEDKAAKEAEKELKRQTDIADQLTIIKNNKIILAGGEVDRLALLESQLATIKEQATHYIKVKDINANIIAEQKKQIEINKENKRLKDKKLEGELEYQKLLGNKAYAKNLEYEKKVLWFKEHQKDVTKEQLILMEKAARTNSMLESALSDLFKGGDVNDITAGLAGTINSNAADDLAGNVMGIFNNSGESFDMESAMVLGANVFSEVAFGDSKNVKRMQDAGSVIGLAIGGPMGSAIGSIAGGMFGSMLGGEVSYRAVVNDDGSVDNVKHTSGGILSSSSNEVVSDLTRTIDLMEIQYTDFLTYLTDFNGKLELAAGTYTDINGAMADEFFAVLSGATINKSQLDEYANIMSQISNLEGRNSMSSLEDSTAEIERLRAEADALAVELGISSEAVLGFYVTTVSDATDEQLKKTEALKKQYEEYAKGLDISVNEAINKIFADIDKTQENITAYNNKDSELTQTQHLIDRGKKSEKQLEDALFGGKDVTLDNYKELVKTLSNPEDLELMSQLGDILVSNAQNTDKYNDSLKALDTVYNDTFLSGADKVSSDTKLLVESLNELGYSLPSTNEEFRAMVDTSGASKEALLGLSASMTTYLESVKAYNELYDTTFLTADNQESRAIEELANSFSLLGYVMPSTNDEFRVMVDNAGDGRNALLDLAPAFTTMTDSAIASARALQQSRETGVVSMYTDINSLDSEIASYMNSIADSTVSSNESLAQSVADIANATKKLFDDAIRSFNDEINSLQNPDDAQAKFDLLVEFNKQQATFDSMLSNGNIDETAFKDNYTGLLASTNGLEEYLNGDGLREALVSQLQLDVNNMETTTSTVAAQEIAQSYGATQSTADYKRLQELQEQRAELEWLSKLAKQDRSVYLTEDGFVRNFSESNDLSLDQVIELRGIAKDGNLTRTEIENLSTLSQSQIDALYLSTDIERASTNAIVAAIDRLGTRVVTKDEMDDLINVGFGVPTPTTQPLTTTSWLTTGFASGGYTGDIGVNDIAGVVHGQEYVVPKNGALVMKSDNSSVFAAMLTELKQMKTELTALKKDSTDQKQLLKINATETRAIRKLQEDA